MYKMSMKVHVYKHLTMLDRYSLIANPGDVESMCYYDTVGRC